MDTIFALSTGALPAAIAIVRVSGPSALDAGRRLAGDLPPPRHAALRSLRDADGTLLDRALVLALPGPDTVTGEDLVELHLHGGRAVVRAVEAALGAQAGCRPAQAGEFTRRALSNARIDLTQAQGLADLLAAENENARRAALAASDGHLARLVHGWMERIAEVAARVEAMLDFGDEDEVGEHDVAGLIAELRPIEEELTALLGQPSVERLNDGVTIVLAGPPNAGKSSLFNALLAREAAIVTPIAGTTRDVLEARVVRDGLPFCLIDTAGRRDAADDPVERIGIERARAAMERADILLWLGGENECPGGGWLVHARADERAPCSGEAIVTSIHDAASIAALWERLASEAGSVLRCTGDMALHAEQRALVAEAREAMRTLPAGDLLLAAEHLRRASAALAAILGVDATEAMLDVLFARFCLGK